jgi:hypothetical protein
MSDGRHHSSLAREERATPNGGRGYLAPTGVVYPEPLE